MNSEELELSLRTEFENYLKSAIADVKQEVSDFQGRIDAQFDEQKKRLQEKIENDLDEQKTSFAEVFQDFSEKFDTDTEIEDSFRESVAEHLKLARDEGARITATAIAEAEKLEQEEFDASPPENTANFTDLLDAVSEISSKDSQSEILKSLVNHATQYTPRGAFFIVKNEHLVGWRTFGTEENENSQSVREIFFPLTAETSLSESVNNLEKVESSFGQFDDDSIYLDQLGFDQPEQMYAIPLVARGRGVAVLYADAGTNGESVNAEALETMVRVAGLTVEVLASGSGRGAKPQTSRQDSYDADEPEEFDEPEAESVETEMTEDYSSTNEEVEEYSFTDTDEVAEDYSFTDTDEEVEEVQETSFQAEPEEEESFSYQQDFQTEPVAESTQYEEVQEDYFPVGNSFEAVGSEEEEENETGFDFQTTDETSEVEAEDFSKVSDEETTSSFGEFEWSPSSETVEETQDFSEDDSDIVEDYAPYESAETDSISSMEDFQTEINQESSVQFDDSQQTDENQFDFQKDESADYSFEAPTANDFSDDYSTAEETSEADSVNSFDRSFQEIPETVQAPAQTESVSTAPVRPRFGDRNVDLPIEVKEDERRLHNDARRFARLLVSEIKLYNEQKVKEGRDSSDLYERLREAIDRSREMYDKRVQPPVAAKFDYFHYELVNTLAEGEEPRLGGSYPGTTV